MFVRTDILNGYYFLFNKVVLEGYMFGEWQGNILRNHRNTTLVIFKNKSNILHFIFVDGRCRYNTLITPVKYTQMG